MTSDYFIGWTLFHGAVRYRDLAYVLATRDELVADDVQHTRVYGWDGGVWGADDLDWTAVSCSVCYLPEERFIAIGPLGRVQVSGGGEFAEEGEIRDQGSSPRQRGPLREVRGIANGRAYAVGTARQVYRRDAPGRWTCIDQSARPTEQELLEVCFESIDGFSESELYAVGWEGEIWNYNGKVWKKIASPTNLALYCVTCAEDGFVYAVGQIGVILRGRRNKWEIIQQEVATEDLWGAEWFAGRLFVASSGEVFELAGSTLKATPWGADRPRSCQRLSARDGIMWSVGEKDIMHHDGKTWSRVLSIAI